MPIRNPFRRNVNGVEAEGTPRDPTGGFQTTATTGAKPVDIKEPLEYKLSEINDSGVYLPPSPPEKRGLWNSSRTSTSSNHRSVLSETEPFNISRESFDSYRRSFDIGARVPVSDLLDSRPPRGSLDSRRALQQRPQRPSFQGRRMNSSEEPVEEGFEEVGLNDENRPLQKRKGLFSRFADSNHGDNAASPSSPTADGRPNSSSHHGFLTFAGRKRGQSGKGEELKNIPKNERERPASRNAAATVAAE